MRHTKKLVILASVCAFGFGCSSKSPSDTGNAPASINQENNTDDSYSTGNSDVSDINLDSLRSLSISSQNHTRKSGIDVCVNRYYDEGYDQGMEDGYNDGMENVRGDSYDDDCNYKGTNRREYELGYEEGYEVGFDDGFADSDYDSELEE